METLQTEETIIIYLYNICINWYIYIILSGSKMDFRF